VDFNAGVASSERRVIEVVAYSGLRQMARMWLDELRERSLKEFPRAPRVSIRHLSRESVRRSPKGRISNARHLEMQTEFFTHLHRIDALAGVNLGLPIERLMVGRAAWHLRPLDERLLMKLRILPGCSQMRPRRPSWIPAAAAPRPVSYGPMPPMTVPGPGRIHRVLPMSMRPIATHRPPGGLQGYLAGRRLCRLRQTRRLRRRPAGILLIARPA
jgi:hypothetical protein